MIRTQSVSIATLAALLLSACAKQESAAPAADMAPAPPAVGAAAEASAPANEARATSGQAAAPAQAAPPADVAKYRRSSAPDRGASDAGSGAGTAGNVETDGGKRNVDDTEPGGAREAPKR